MQLHVLWQNTTGSRAAKTQAELLDKDIKLIVETDKELARQHYSWMHVLVDGNPSEEALNAPSLSHVIVPFVGINKDLREKMLGKPHLRLYNSHFNDASVAQHAVALLLAVANRIPEADAALHKGNWQAADPFHSIFLEAKTCLLLGYGAIGQAIEKRLRGFAMHFVALKRSETADTDIKIYTADKLYEALSVADVIMCSLPLTPDTKNLLNDDAFKAMKPGSILVNVGRGEVIDQHALYRALKSQQLFGAGIDVWWNYPKGKEARKNTLPADAALHELSNIVMSPHRAAAIQNWEDGSFFDTAKTLNALVRGQSRNQVDPQRGY